ncbi:hypothetical protein TSAR_013630 [Trichomalopsis sarcophagae]|uniref:Uncharacterized protein n=1 Tax=Trichomalopsis sarcophagae TaxID=543379 RepID=A0A232F998_9HYME|nr:hypothetical protein TSAR_013630 [Trichomalopsis sarcophagae]
MAHADMGYRQIIERERICLTGGVIVLFYAGDIVLTNDPFFQSPPKGYPSSAVHHASLSSSASDSGAEDATDGPTTSRDDRGKNLLIVIDYSSTGIISTIQ